MVAPESVLPVEASITLPFNVFCANDVIENIVSSNIDRIIRFIIEISLIKKDIPNPVCNNLVELKATTGYVKNIKRIWAEAKL